MTVRTGQPSPSKTLCVFGPREGFSPQIGILVSQLHWARRSLLSRLSGLSEEDLDHLPDPRSNSIGALLLHVAATETYYWLHTCEGLPWAAYAPAVVERWGPAMALGDVGRNCIRGHDLPFYLSALEETREATLAALRQRDDAWLMAVDPPGRGGRPTTFASGSTCANTKRTTRARSSCY